jgi:hypothetical protein
MKPTFQANSYSSFSCCFTDEYLCDSGDKNANQEKTFCLQSQTIIPSIDQNCIENS